MTTLYIATKRNHRGTLDANNGTIVGLSRISQADLQSKFPGADLYTTMEDTSPNWDYDAIPGWELENGVVVRRLTPTDLENLKNLEIPQTYEMFETWESRLTSEHFGHSTEQLNLGHDILYRSRGGLYLICNDSNYTVSQRIACCQSIRQGAADITTVEDFYNNYTGTTPTGWISWVDPSNATRLNLDDSIVIQGTIPASIHLAHSSWSSDIVS